MKFTPKQMRETIDILRTRQLRLDHTFETYEAIVVNTDASIDKVEWMTDLERLRKQNRINRENLRKRLTLAEEILAEDEKVNGWMGEYRLIEVAL